MFAQPLRRIAAFAATFAAASLLSACAFMDFDVSGMSGGVPLAELDMEGEAPTVIRLAGPDTVIITEGETLDITVEGDPAVTEKLRFKLDDEDLIIGREDDSSGRDGKATIRVTMPAPIEIAVAGSGSITAPTVDQDAELEIAGSGSITVTKIDADRLVISIGGSGTVTAAGEASELEINVAGSGDVRLGKLMADTVEVSIAGSGDVELASNGTVDASIAGSGDVTVTGDAKCNLSSMGSGKLTCRPASAAAAADPAEPAEASETAEPTEPTEPAGPTEAE